MSMRPVEIDWSSAPLAGFVKARTRRAIAHIDALPAPPSNLQDIARPKVILIAVDSGWPAFDLVQRLSANGLRVKIVSLRT